MPSEAAARLEDTANAVDVGPGADARRGARPVGGRRSGGRAATKWLEGTGRREPPVWDVLAVAHGPFHQLIDDPTTFVTLEHGALVDALIVRALELHPHDLHYPRSAGLDAPLYCIDRPWRHGTGGGPG